MATQPTLSDVLYALKITTGKNPFDAKYDVNGDGEVTTADVLGLQKAYVGKDPGFAFANNTFVSPSTKTAEDYAAEAKANQERIAAEQAETARRQTLLTDAQKLNGRVNADLVANNPNFNAQQLASLAQRNYWSNESEAFSRVMTAMENGTAQLKQVQTGYMDETGNPETELRMVAPDGPPGYNSLTLRATPQPGVYQFSTPNQAAGGTISGVIQADPTTGKYAPVQDYTKQIAYTPGQSGSVLGGVIGDLGDIYKSLGPVGTILGNAVAPGLGTALSAAAAIDEGKLGSVAKGLLLGEGLNQLGVGSTIADVTGSQAAGAIGQDLTKGLLSGQSLDTALTNAVVNNLNTIGKSVNEIAGPPAPPQQAVETPSIFQDTTSVVQDAFKGSEYENLISGQDLSADSILGNTVNDIISTLSQDTVSSTVAQDTLVSGQDLAADTLTGSTLDDVIKKLTEDTVTGTIGQDTVSTVVDTVTGSEGTDTVTGGEATTQGGTGVDTIVSGTGEDTVSTTVDTVTGGQDTVVSGQDLASDTLTGSTLDDIIKKLTEDTVVSGTATDTVTGGQDTLVSGQDLAADSVVGNTLQDVIDILTNDTTVSGQDLSADTGTGANTLNDVAIALSSEGDAVSGQDLAADATAGNTLADVSNALATDTTATTEQKDTGLTPAQIANLLRFGAGLFGTTGLLSKVIGTPTAPSTPSTALTPDIKPFTGTYGGMNMNTPEYYQQVQQNYNRLFPTSNVNVSKPLEDWYKTQFTPVTTKLFGV